MTNRLSYERFRENILAQTKTTFVDQYGAKNVLMDHAVKNNDTILERLTIDFGDGLCCPCLYPEELYQAYQDGVSMEEILDELKKFYGSFVMQAAPDAHQWMDAITNLDTCMDLISCKLINRQENHLRLKDCPYLNYGEFAVSFQLKISDGADGFYFTQITNELLSGWNISLDQLYTIALQNANFLKTFTLKSIDDVLQIPSSCGLFVLTTSSQINGASILLSNEVLQKSGRYLGGDFYLLPSSVHELLLLPQKQGAALSDLIETVRYVNGTPTVSSDEFLSNNVYEYSLSQGQVILSATGEVLTLEHPDKGELLH